MTSSLQPSAQLKFRLPGVTVAAPLVGIETARAALKELDYSEDDILAAIAEGQLIAFDLRGAKSERSFLRIFTPSLETLKQSLVGRVPQPGVLAEKNPCPSVSFCGFDSIFNLCFRHSKPVIKSPELHRVWNCGSDHIHDLIAQRLLTVTANSPSRRHCNAPAYLERAVIAAFMKARQL